MCRYIRVIFRECGHDFKFKIDPCGDYQEDYVDDYFLDPRLLIPTQQEPSNLASQMDLDAPQHGEVPKAMNESSGND